MHPLDINELGPPWIGKYIYGKDGSRVKILRIAKTPRMPYPLVTLEDDQGVIDVRVAEALKDFSVKRLAKKNALQKLAGKYRKRT